MSEAKPRFRFGWVLSKAVFYLSLILSLLVFPSGLPWMLLGWTAAAMVQGYRGKAAWPLLAVPFVLIMIRGFDAALGLVVFVGVMGVVGVGDFMARRGKGLSREILVRSGGPLLVMAWIGMAWHWNASLHTSRRPELLSGRPVVCVGDSLTVFGFPKILDERLTIPVLDRSTGGINSEQALEKLPEILERNPQVVVIELGGHDYLQHREREATGRNLRKFIEASRSIGAEVILFEIPRGFVFDPYRGLERSLAREYDLEVIPDTAIRNLIIWSPVNPTGEGIRKHLSDDGLHPNEQGHAYLADWVTGALVRMYGSSILRK